VSLHDDASLPEKLGGAFDLIIDDGNHHGPTVTSSFRLLWPLVKPGGYYVVEDWMISLRAGERPLENWRSMDNGLMLTAITQFLYLLRYPDSECLSVEYRYGLAIVRKRSSE
jgi:cephalosporin hydroxylase